MNDRAPPVWPVFAAFAVAVAIAIGGSIALVVLALIAEAVGGTDPGDLTAAAESVVYRPWVLIGSVAITSTTVLALALIVPGLEKARLRDRLRLHGTGRDVRLGVLGAVVVIGLGAVMETAATLLGLLEGSTLGVLAEVTRTMPVGWFAVLLVVGSVGPGVGEELFFRGYVETRLVQRWGRWAGIVVASALFGLMHMDYLHAPMAFLMGLVFGWLAESTGSIRPGVLAHLLNNAFSFGVGRVASPDEAPWPIHLLGALAGLSFAVAAVLGIVLVMSRARRAAPA